MALAASILVGCSQATPPATPPVITATPGASTVGPALTPFPPAATNEPTAAAASPTAEQSATSPATLTSAPVATSTATLAPVVPTNTRVPFTPKPQPSATETAVVLKYPAPELLEPENGTSRQAGKDDLVFKWRPVADLGSDECYEVSFRIINTADPGQPYNQATLLAKDTCGSLLSANILQFVLYTKKHGTPSYDQMIDAVSQSVQANVYQARWWVTVVRTDETPISPPSAQFQFILTVP